MRTRTLAVLTLAAWTFSAQGQTINAATDATLQALVGRDANGFKSCGIRAVVMHIPGDHAEVYDFSISIQRSLPAGLIKAGKTQVSMKEYAAKKLMPPATTPPPTRFWISQATEGVPLSSGKLIPADDKGFILSSGDIGLTIQTIYAVANGADMQFSLRYPSDRLDRVFAFSAKVKESEGKSLTACMESVILQLKQELEKRLKREELNDAQSPKD